MFKKFSKVLADWFYLVPFAVNRYRKAHPNETVLAYGATKAHRTDQENVVKSYNWALSRRGTLILTDTRLVCGDWAIPLPKVKYAEVLTYGSGYILKAGDNEGNHYQFAIQQDLMWTEQTALSLKMSEEELRMGRTTRILRYVALGGVALWWVYQFFNFLS
ncbi:MAG: hypothetical protein AAFN11_08510 [Chloroflexota bacterium]